MPQISGILIVPHTHHDVCYTHVPETILRMHEHFIYEAMTLCEQDGDDASPSAFRWTVEATLPLINFLRHASADDILRLQSLVACKRLSVTAGYLHMTQLIGHEEYVRFFQPVREIRR